MFLNKCLDKMAPKSLKNKVGELLNEMGAYIQTGGSYLISNRKYGSDFRALLSRLRKFECCLVKNGPCGFIIGRIPDKGSHSPRYNNWLWRNTML
jgi:hypothetical protein